MSAITRALVTLADHWLPRQCALCDRPLSPERHGFCASCEHTLPGRRTPRCGCCGIARAAGNTPCAACVASPPPWTRTLVLADYAPPLDRLVVALKFQGALPAAQALGAQLGQMLARAVRIDALSPPYALVPVPLGSARLVSRGYNQAELLARAAVRASGVHVRGAWLRRHRETSPQSELGAQARASNLADAFTAEEAVRGRHIVLVDDVMTSGATLKAAALALKAAGAASVINLVVARTP